MHIHSKYSLGKLGELAPSKGQGENGEGSSGQTSGKQSAAPARTDQETGTSLNWCAYIAEHRRQSNTGSVAIPRGKASGDMAGMYSRVTIESSLY